jgi:hypothetical protein
MKRNHEHEMSPLYQNLDFSFYTGAARQISDNITQRKEIIFWKTRSSDTLTGEAKTKNKGFIQGAGEKDQMPLTNNIVTVQALRFLSPTKLTTNGHLH